MPFYFFPYSRLFSYLLCLFLYLISLSYFVLAVPLREGLEKHSWMSSSCPVAILSGTCFFPTVQLQVHNVYSERKTRNSCAVVNLCLFWNDLVDPVFDGVGLAGFKSRSNAFLLA